MKKILLIGCVLVFGGLVLFSAGYFISGQDFSVLNTHTDNFVIDMGDTSSGGLGSGDTSSTNTGVKNEYTFSSDGVSAIYIDESSSDVRFGLSDDDLIHVFCYETKNNRYEITTGSTLKIERGSGHGLGAIFSLDLSGGDSRDLTVLLPAECVKGGLELTTKSFSGSIFLEKSMEFSDVSLSSESGEIVVTGISVKDIHASSSSGDITISQLLSAADIRLSSTSGEVKADSCSAAGLFEIDTTSGDIKLRDVTANEIGVSTTSGETDCGRVSGSDVSFASTSGDVYFDLIDASSSVRITTVSGGLEGTLSGAITDYSITVRTISGESNLPDKLNAGNIDLMVESTSGDIDIDFAK